VRSPAVAAPAAVRYGWHELAIGNLENGAGLPASPFRTDK
jgi:sialate O-acetylesterase